ncbi:alpha/beta hydrolase [Serpentinicella sp. ANB-PHB4]|uniref:alpha/beta fold hydrolase n=1 Tax=Serpentinicella sp. ANB-PHB4 TaxID=3074076 RepID=UPI00285FD481|nr:alpha/beta hydrolase [Serpentinicella sp. ANB-PHB4]MDR5660008.1 alpha/beta hydrolase [Serpentinicella sp. ANB-PHB4]
MIRTSFHHVKVNLNMPSNVKKEDIKNYSAPTLLLTGEKDVLFPGEKVTKRATEIIPNVETHILQDWGHLYFTSEERKQQIKRITNEFLTK